MPVLHAAGAGREAEGKAGGAAGPAGIGMPVAGQLTSAFSARRFHPILHVVRPHWGSDYAAPAGTPVLASADGVVTAAVHSPSYGLAVELSHWGGRLVTRYAHLSAVTVRPGERVRRGQVIGRVGASGLATGPHLHFEIFVGGRRRDPARLLDPADAVSLR